MKTELELSDSIYEQLNNEANQRGVTISEIIRWIIGDYNMLLQALGQELLYPLFKQYHPLIH